MVHGPHKSGKGGRRRRRRRAQQQKGGQPAPPGEGGHQPIPHLNDLPRLRACLAALERQTYPTDRYEVLVVDNGSDGEVAAAVAAFPHAVLAREERRSSYAARNRGLSLARGAIIAFTDSDCIPASHFAVTANLFTCRQVLDDVGHFNPHLQSGGDREWGRRVHAVGYVQLYAPEVCVAHPARRTWAELAAKAHRVVRGSHDLGASRWSALPWLLVVTPSGMVRRVWRRSGECRL